MKSRGLVILFSLEELHLIVVGIHQPFSPLRQIECFFLNLPLDVIFSTLNLHDTTLFWADHLAVSKVNDKSFADKAFFDFATGDINFFNLMLIAECR